MTTSHQLPEPQSTHDSPPEGVVQQRLVRLVGGRWVVADSPGPAYRILKNTEAGGSGVMAWGVSMWFRDSGEPSKFLVGPRPPQDVKKHGYSFSDSAEEAWLFASRKQAGQKAKVLKRHFGEGSKVETGVTELLLVKVDASSEASPPSN